MATPAAVSYHVSVTNLTPTGYSYLALCNIVYWLALTVWVAVLVAAGVAAMSSFTTLPDPDLGVTLDRFAAFDAAEHGRIAAGLVMEPVFTFVDITQVAAAGVVVLMAALQMTLFRGRWKSLMNLLRLACIAAALALLLTRVFTISPDMNADLRLYWQAAEAGNAEQALTHRASFDAMHETASTMFRWTLISLLVCVAASAVALGPRRPQHRPTELQKPQLAA